MSPSLEVLQSLNYSLALFGVFSVFVSAYIFHDLHTKRRLQTVVERFGMHAAGLVSLIGTTLTLVYSEIFGILPCGLCWLERIALYPQILIAGVAIYYKDVLAARHGIALSVFGLIVSLYHHYIQMGGSEFIKCPASGAADCAKRFLFEFNFVTFPLLAAFLFVLLIILYLYILKTRTR